MNKKYFPVIFLVSLFFNVISLTSCSNDDIDSSENEEITNDSAIDELDEDVDNTESEQDETTTPTEEDVNNPADENEEETEPPIVDPEVIIEDEVSCSATYGDNYIAFEAEDTDSDLGEWRLIKSGEEGYFDDPEVSPINETHMEFTGNNQSSGPANSPLDYVFIAPTTGQYRLLMRLYQRLEGQEEDKSNDVFIRLAGNFTSGTDAYTTNDLQTDLKFFGRGVNEWGSAHSGDGGELENKSAIIYNLIEGEQYVFTMSGRSKNANIDYILFHETSINITAGSHRDIAALNDPQFRPDWDCSQQ